GSVRLPLLAGLPLMAIQLALLEWFRGAELSCDRAAALVTRDPLAVCRALMVISAGEAAEQLSLDAFINQAMDYSEGGKGLEKLTRMLHELGLTHPMPVRRVRHLLDWVRAGGYDRIVGGEYLRGWGWAWAGSTGSWGGSTCAAARTRRCATRPTPPRRSTRHGSPTRSRPRAPRSARSASSSATGWRASAAAPARTTTSSSPGPRGEGRPAARRGGRRGGARRT